MEPVKNLITNTSISVTLFDIWYIHRGTIFIHICVYTQYQIESSQKRFAVLSIKWQLAKQASTNMTVYFSKCFRSHTSWCLIYPGWNYIIYVHAPNMRVNHLRNVCSHANHMAIGYADRWIMSIRVAVAPQAALRAFQAATRCVDFCIATSEGTGCTGLRMPLWWAASHLVRH